MPLSPVSSTVLAGLLATLASSVLSEVITSESPTIRSKAYGWAWAVRNCRTSRRSRVVSSARETSADTSSRLNGLLAKWYAPIFIASTAVSIVA